MRTPRTLVLAKETLSELSPAELAAVAGAESGLTCKLSTATETLESGASWCASILEPCISWGTCTTR